MPSTDKYRYIIYNVYKVIPLECHCGSYAVSGLPREGNTLIFPQGSKQKHWRAWPRCCAIWCSVAQAITTLRNIHFPFMGSLYASSRTLWGVLFHITFSKVSKTALGSALTTRHPCRQQTGLCNASTQRWSLVCLLV